MIVLRRHFLRSVWPVACLATGLLGCVPLGMTLPSDDMMPPSPEGFRIKPGNGWLTTERAEIVGGAPEGSIAITTVSFGGRKVLQQVRHYLVGQSLYGDSILLERTTLRPIETFRFTPTGTYIARYNHRVIQRVFKPLRGGAVTSTETLDIEPYSALGMELIIAAMPLHVGLTGVFPVAIDTAQRGWAMLKFTVHSEQQVQERRDQKALDLWVVECENGPGARGLDRTRLWIAIDGRSVRKIEHVDADNVVLSTLRRMLLAIPSQQHGL